MIDFYHLEMFCKKLDTLLIYVLFEIIQQNSYDRLEGKNILGFLATKYTWIIIYKVKYIVNPFKRHVDGSRVFFIPFFSFLVFIGSKYRSIQTNLLTNDEVEERELM